ncbi:MAG: hypothetical protein FWC33_01055, partial [Candidatus Bathyarchaeota archaeon]|nr:hypothetical protein [Candidatus Termiticorpusculum sp.]
LSFLITFTGATSIEQLLVCVKLSAIVVNWLLFFSMYLLGKRIFNKKIGMIAASLLLLCFPMFELNMWGGYTTVLGIAFMLLLFLYLPLSVEHKSYMIAVGIFAFALVLSHQLTLFVAALILAPVMLFLIIKSKGKGIKTLLFLIIGGGLSFFLYYVRAMLPYLGDLIGHIFFAQKAMSYQIPQTSLAAFWSNFSFVLILGAVGLFVCVYKLWIEKKHVSNLTLVLSFLIPLVLAKSYLFGLYLPFYWFVYYITPLLAFFAAVFLFFAFEKICSYYQLHKAHIKRVYVKVVAVGVIILSCSALVISGDMLGSRISGMIPYFATSDSQSLQVGKWLKANYPDPVGVVVTEAPGFWFSAFCEKDVIVEINPAVERNVISESILALSYEVETPLTLLRAYEAKGDVTSEYYVSINDVWLLGAFSSVAGDYVSYNVNGVYKEVPLRHMGRYYLWDNSQAACNLTIIYANDDVLVSQSQLISSSTYSNQVLWDITPVNTPISNVTLYISTFFYLQFNFDKAYLPGVLNWENPWANPTDSYNAEWAVTDFSKNNLTDDYIAVRDEQKQVYYAMKFHDLPDWGNIGALGNKQIDAIRLTYKFEQISPDKSASFSYQTLFFSEERYHQTVSPSQLREMFTTKPVNDFSVVSRDYLTLIEKYNVGFIVYDKNKLDPNIVRCSILELVYSNNRYAVFRVNYSKSS